MNIKQIMLSVLVLVTFVTVSFAYPRRTGREVIPMRSNQTVDMRHNRGNVVERRGYQMEKRKPSSFKQSRRRHRHNRYTPMKRGECQTSRVTRQRLRAMHSYSDDVKKDSRQLNKNFQQFRRGNNQWHARRGGGVERKKPLNRDEFRTRPDQDRGRRFGRRGPSRRDF